MDADAEAARRLERGLELEGYAFTFCKAAFLCLVLQRYSLLGTSLAATLPVPRGRARRRNVSGAAS
jgi:hypothetical protein